MRGCILQALFCFVYLRGDVLSLYTIHYQKTVVDVFAGYLVACCSPIHRYISRRLVHSKHLRRGAGVKTYHVETSPATREYHAPSNMRKSTKIVNAVLGTLPCHLPLVEISCVHTSIFPSSNTSTLYLSTYKVALINCSIFLGKCPLAMLVSIHPLTSVGEVGVWVGVRTKTMPRK